MKTKSINIPRVYVKNNTATTREPVIFHVSDISEDTIWGLYYNWEIDIDGWNFTVPRLATTNLGTVPWFCRWFISPNDPLIAIPSIAHDFIVNEWTEQFTFIDDNGEMIQVSGSNVPWSVSTKLFYNYGYKRAKSRKDRFRLKLVYYGMLAYGFLLNK